MLTEWKRTLKPGGQLILELPCMDKILYYMATCLMNKEPLNGRLSWYAMWGDPKDQDHFMAHKWGYTKQMVVDLLTSVGFESIEVKKPQYHFPIRDMRIEAYKGGL